MHLRKITAWGLLGSLGLVPTLVLGLDCRRHAAPAPPEPLTQVPAPFPSAPLARRSAEGPDLANLVERVRPAVVNLTAVHEIAVRSPERGWPFRDLLPPLPGRQGRGGDEVLQQRALGSGFLVDADGHVVTNAHVVDQADVVEVKLTDEREFRARILAKDEMLDVAVLQLEHAPRDLPVASLGSSSALRVGDSVVAIGNPFGLGDTVTLGIVSAKGRALGAGPYDDFIQTDASINPGNSGGPLFDMRGQVVGINTAMNPQGRGIGFAIPIDEVKRELPQLIARERIARGRLGVTIQRMDDALARALGLDRVHGALVVEVQPDGPAARGGIEAGDVILTVEGQDVAQAFDLPRIVAQHAPGSHVKLTVLRHRDRLGLEVTLGALRQTPEGVTAKQASEPARDQEARSPLGIDAGDAPGRGALVVTVRPGGPAEGKLLPGDVIEAVNDRPVTDARDLARAMRVTNVPLLLRVRRQDRGLYVGIEPER